MSALHSALLRSLGAPFGDRARAVEDWASALGLGIGSLEASVRVGDRGATGNRMMIERVPASAVAGFFEALGVSLGGRARSLADAAEALALPTIVGWDASATSIAKLYVNASDASVDVRGRLARALGLREAAPHVVGLNVSPSGVEEKTYVQSAAPPSALDDGLVARFAKLVAEDVVGGWVLSSTQTSEGPRPRAVFAALRAGHPSARAAVAKLLGWNEQALAEALPFAMGAIKSVGVDVRAPQEWTVYFKPAESAAESWDLEPVLVVRTAAVTERPAVELGLFAEPASLGRRAWAEAAGHALSYRVREGVVHRAFLEALQRWASARLAAGIDPAALALDAAPPEPWHVVDVS